MSNPRIIAGTAKGLRLNSVPGESTRPITDRVKEALFNIISGDIENASFIDLFAGTGSVGIEALSRGASFVRFIEKNPIAEKILRSNLIKSKLGEKGDIIFGDAFHYVQSMKPEQFDYIYIAPPQYHGWWVDMLHKIDANTHHLKESAWIIAQIDPIEYLEMKLQYLAEFDQRKYGDTLLIFYYFGGIN